MAGTWINMQDAFAQEKGRVGTWLEIGYTAPGSASNGKSTYKSKVFTYGSADDSTWTATPNSTALNECGTDKSWKLNATTSSNGDVTIADGGTDSECKVLTASWDNLMKTGN